MAWGIGSRTLVAALGWPLVGALALIAAALGLIGALALIAAGALIALGPRPVGIIGLGLGPIATGAALGTLIAALAARRTLIAALASLVSAPVGTRTALIVRSLIIRALVRRAALIGLTAGGIAPAAVGGIAADGSRRAVGSFKSSLEAVLLLSRRRLARFSVFRPIPFRSRFGNWFPRLGKRSLLGCLVLGRAERRRGLR